uniref:Transmembrane protein n=1 Tax=Trepomonas sp. PC1 TaxID=1076344 RepID=A0A146JWF6_9EUKA|eukprot:JAP88912.1 Hypothetical protein TPC1_31593 [Trepomonas sp. PC1]
MQSNLTTIFYWAHGTAIIVTLISIFSVIVKMKIIQLRYQAKWIPVINLAFMMQEVLYYIITISIALQQQDNILPKNLQGVFTFLLYLGKYNPLILLQYVNKFIHHHQTKQQLVMMFSKKFNPSNVMFYWNKCHLIFGVIFGILCVTESLLLRFTENTIAYYTVNFIGNLFCLTFACYLFIAAFVFYKCSKKLESKMLSRYIITIVIVNSFSQFGVSFFYNVMQIISLVDSSILNLDGPHWLVLKQIKDIIFCGGLTIQSLLIMGMQFQISKQIKRKVDVTKVYGYS